jgi:hypothetical protein
MRDYRETRVAEGCSDGVAFAPVRATHPWAAADHRLPEPVEDRKAADRHRVVG